MTIFETTMQNNLTTFLMVGEYGVIARMGQRRFNPFLIKCGRWRNGVTMKGCNRTNRSKIVSSPSLGSEKVSICFKKQILFWWDPF